MNKKTMTRERDIIKDLYALRYMFIELSRKDERSTMLFLRDKKTGKSQLTPAVCIRLAVPVDSVLGAQIIAMRKSNVTRNKRNKR